MGISVCCSFPDAHVELRIRGSGVQIPQGANKINNLHVKYASGFSGKYPTVAVLREPSKRGKRHVLAGPIALTWPEVAARLTQLLGRTIYYYAVSIEERRAQLEAAGLDLWRVELVLGLEEISRSDLYAHPTGTVPQLTGHPPRTVEDYIEHNRAAFA
jgi:hypothetical protein